MSNSNHGGMSAPGKASETGAVNVLLEWDYLAARAHESDDFSSDHYRDAAIARAAIVTLIAERDATVKLAEGLEAAYQKARNSAAGYSNYCDDNANTRRCERELDEAEKLCREAIDAARKGSG